MKKKLLYLITALFLLAPTIIWAQGQGTDALFTPCLTTPNVVQANRIASWTAQLGKDDYQLVWVNKELFLQNSVTIAIAGEQPFDIQLSHRKQIGTGYIWNGLRDEWGTSHVVVSEEGITGQFFNGLIQYSIFPIGDGLHLLFPSNAIPDELCGTDEEPPRVSSSQHSVPAEDEPNYLDSEGNLRALAAGDCKIRVLVAYNSDMYTNYADPIGRIQSLLTVWNNSNANSDVDFEAELVRVIEVDYTTLGTTGTNPVTGSSSTVTDLIRFYETSDGFMDYIHGLRNQYDADMCMIMLGNLITVGGQALTIQAANSSEAFCLMKNNNRNTTFPHEFAHLMACRHDFYVDPSITPYTFGHGFTNTAGTNFRTVMAYENACIDAGTTCDRIQNWSNPAILSGGNPTGNGLAANNLVLNIEAPRIAAFQSTVVDKSVFQADSINAFEMADLYATQTITTDNVSFIVRDDGAAIFRASDNITLTPGFLAESGATFDAVLEAACTDLLVAPVVNRAALAAGEVTLDDVEIGGVAVDAASTDAEQSFAQDEIAAHPNPFKDFSQLSFTIANKGTAEALLFDAQGRMLKRVDLGELDAGMHQLKLQNENYAAGIYHCVIQSGQQQLKIRLSITE